MKKKYVKYKTTGPPIEHDVKHTLVVDQADILYEEYVTDPFGTTVTIALRPSGPPLEGWKAVDFSPANGLSRAVLMGEEEEDDS